MLQAGIKGKKEITVTLDKTAKGKPSHGTCTKC